MRAHQDQYPVATMCRVLDVSTSGYYAWRNRPLSARAQADEVLQARIEAIHTKSRGTYGVPRMHAELRAEGICVGHKRIARLMARAGLQGVSRRRYKTTTLQGKGRRPDQTPRLVPPSISVTRC